MVYAKIKFASVMQASLVSLAQTLYVPTTVGLMVCVTTVAVNVFVLRVLVDLLVKMIFQGVPVSATVVLEERVARGALVSACCPLVEQIAPNLAPYSALVLAIVYMAFAIVIMLTLVLIVPTNVVQMIVLVTEPVTKCLGPSQRASSVFVSLCTVELTAVRNFVRSNAMVKVFALMAPVHAKVPIVPC